MRSRVAARGGPGYPHRHARAGAAAARAGRAADRPSPSTGIAAVPPRGSAARSSHAASPCASFPSPCREFTARPADPSPSPNQPSKCPQRDCFVAALLAMTTFLLSLRAKRSNLVGSRENGPQLGAEATAMTANLPLLSGGQLVVASLRAHRVDMAFSV